MWVAIWACLTQLGISQEWWHWGWQHPQHRAGIHPRDLARKSTLTSFHSLLPEPCTKRTTTAERGAEPGYHSMSRCAPCPAPSPTWVRLGEGVHVQEVPEGIEPGVSHPECHLPGPVADPHVLPHCLWDSTMPEGHAGTQGQEPWHAGAMQPPPMRFSRTVGRAGSSIASADGD